MLTNQHIEFESDSKMEDILCSWIGKINIVQMAILPKAVYRFNVILIKLPMNFSYRTKIILKFVWIYKRLKITKAIHRKKNKSWEDITLPDVVQHYKSVVVRTSW